MRRIRDEFDKRVAILNGASADELYHRLTGLITWMQQDHTVNALLEKLKGQVDLKTILSKRPAHPHLPPPASTLEEIAAIGLLVMEQCKSGKSIHTIAWENGLGGTSSNLNEIAYSVLSKYIEPLLSYIRNSLPEEYDSFVDNNTVSEPPIIKESLDKFRADHPQPNKSGFLMMKFGQTPAHTAITEAVRTTLAKYDLEALRADEQEYHEDLFPNVQTYLHGCGFGIAVMERIEAEDFNPNVSLEIGYMLAQRKPVLLLKDSTLKQLQADLVGKLYREFDFQKPHETIPPPLKSWLEDKGLI